MDLQLKVEQLIQQENLIDKANDRVLIALSGGRDSICLFNILYELGYDLGLAHVNHQLRGTQADEDEHFVRETALRYHIPYFSKTVPVKALAKANKQNVHQFARTIRYDFFNEVCGQQGFTKIATAHHLDDQIESFLFNFSRGTGLRGLAGIAVQRGKIIRPLIHCSRTEIDLYVRDKKLEFREDESNEKLDYSRNFIRHKIIPLFEKLNFGFQSNAAQSLEIMSQTKAFYESQIELYHNKLLQTDGNLLKIEQAKLYNEPNGRIILYEILQKFHFNKDQIDSIFKYHSGNGQLYLSHTHKLLADRTHWIIRENKAPAYESMHIPVGGIRIPNIGKFKIRILDQAPNDLTTRLTAFFDAEKIAFPLILRHWKAGDFFYPLNMDGKKQKLKNYFINEKINRFEKEEIWLLESAGQIIWLIGQRMDDRFKLTEQTNSFCSIQFIPDTI